MAEEYMTARREDLAALIADEAAHSPRSPLRRLASYAAVAYLAVGGVFGSMLYAAIPAMNVLGWAYYTLTWPAFVWHANTHIGPAPWVPPWSFTFRDDR